MTTILQGVPGSARQLMRVLSDILLKYEPHLKRIYVTMQEQTYLGELHFKGAGQVSYGTTFMPEGRGAAIYETTAVRSEAFPRLIRQTHRKIRTAVADGAYDMAMVRALNKMTKAGMPESVRIA